MKTLITGAIAAVIGFLTLIIWRSEFLDLLAGAIPIMVLLGGCLAMYLGFDELKDDWRQDNNSETSGIVAGNDVDEFKKENEELKKEIESLKNNK